MSSTVLFPHFPMYDFYIASRYRNKDSVLELTQRIRAQGYSVYCFVESAPTIEHLGPVDGDAQEAMQKFEALDWRTDRRVREVFEADINAIHASRSVILLLPAGKSAHVEAGIAYGLGKPLILIGEQKETESLYLIFNQVHHSIITFLTSLPKKM